MHFRRIDPTEDPKVGELTELFRVGSTITDPPQLLRHFGRWFGTQRPGNLYISASRRGLPRDRFKITRLMEGGVAQASVGPIPNPWKDWQQLEARAGGFVGEVLSLDRPQVFTELDLADDPHIGAYARDMKSALAVPIYDGGEGLNWSIWFYRTPEPPKLDQLPQTLLDSNLLGMATKNLVERRRSDELNTRLTQQLEQIASIQRSLLPQRLPHIEGARLATSYLTSEESGGDYYDFFRFGERRWGILIADVSGHGPAAATVMAMLRAILHCYGDNDPCPGQVMEYANRKLCGSNLEGSFVTAFFALYEPETGRFSWARCGHNPPRIKRGDRVFEVDGAASVPLGIIDDLEIEPVSARLEPMDTVVMYTDGITEAMNPHRELFGTERMDEALKGCSGEPECVIDSVHARLFAHTGVMSRVDDQTLVVLRHIGVEAGLDGGPAASGLAVVSDGPTLEPVDGVKGPA